jgi:orotidine-5'-phosphate decarboxylase
MEEDNTGDQKRIATPEFARDAGVSSIVVGRSITRSNNPVNSYEKWLDAWRRVQQ